MEQRSTTALTQLVDNSNSSRQEFLNQKHKQACESDPIKSIANVLNTHHKEQLFGAQVDSAPSKQVEKSYLKKKGQQANKVDQSQVDTSNNSRQEALLHGGDKVPASKRHLQHHSATSYNGGGANQVDQGNCYLYAYNDYIAAGQVWPQQSQLARGGDDDHILDLQPFVGCEHLHSSAEQNERTEVIAYKDEDDDDDDESEDEEENEALNYILNQHLSGTESDTEQQAPTTSQKCLLAGQEVAICDNHLRRYLQIEENFNSFKAANKLEPWQLQRHKPQHTATGSLIVDGNTAQAPNCFVVSSSQLDLVANQHHRQQFAEQAAGQQKQNQQHNDNKEDELERKEKVPFDTQQQQQTNHANQLDYLRRQSQNNAKQLQQHTTVKATSCGNFLVFVPATHAAIQSQQQQEVLEAGQEQRTGRERKKKKKKQSLPLIKSLRGDLTNNNSDQDKLTSTSNLLLFAGLRNTKQQHKLNKGDEQEMYAPNGGQPGAYYVTSSSVTGTNHNHQHHQLNDQSSASNGQSNYDQNLHHHNIHLHHHLQQKSLHVNNSNNNNNHYQSSSSADSSLGSSGAFATAAAVAATALTSGHHHRRRTNRANSLLTSCARNLLSCSWLRDFCSKKCLFITCLISLLFIFILVISLSAYLNFLITASKSNLQPLSGRLRYDLLPQQQSSNSNNNEDSTSILSSSTTPQQLQLLFNNKTSKEFLHKQQQFETILRGALDRTQSLLKTYPNHLVKLEVYSFKPLQQQNVATTPISLWVYFRLFVNKRTIQQDTMLMKRKSPDELFEKQFLPRLTQQTLHSGFEQLISVFGARLAPTFSVSSTTELHFNGGNNRDQATATSARRSNVIGQQQQATNNGVDQQLTPNARRLGARAVSSAPSSGNSAQSSQQLQLRSFDEQISRLIRLVEAIDLQSIQVTPEFDMQSSIPSSGATQDPPIMSDNLRALQPIVVTTTSTTALPPIGRVMVATSASSASGKLLSADDEQNVGQQRQTTPKSETLSGPGSRSSPRPASGGNDGLVNESDDSIDVSTRKFTLQGYRENTNRPIIPSTNAPTVTSSSRPQASQKESLFLVNQQQKKRVNQIASSTSNIFRDIDQATAARQAESFANENSSNKEKVVRLVSGQPVVSQNPHLNDAALSEHFGNANSLRANNSTNAPTTIAIASKASQDKERLLFNATVARSRSSQSPTRQQQPPLETISSSIEELWNNALRTHNSTGGGNTNSRRLITVTTIGGQPHHHHHQQQQQVANGGRRVNESRQDVDKGTTDLRKISITLDNDVSDAIRAQISTTTIPATTMTDGSSIVSSSTTKAPKVSPHLKLAGSLVSTPNDQRARENASAIVLNREVTSPSSNHSLDAQQSNRVVNGTTTITSTTSSQRNQKQKQKASASVVDVVNNSTLNSNQTSTAKRTPKPNIKRQKLKKVVASSAQHNASSVLSDGKRPASGTRLQGESQSHSTVGGGGTVTNSTTRSAKLTAGGTAHNTNKTLLSSQAEFSGLPTLPTTIELTRSASTASPPHTSAPTFVTSSNQSNDIDNNLARNETAEIRVIQQAGNRQHTQDSSSQFVPANQQSRPGTSNFSGQWKPLQSTSSAAIATTSNLNQSTPFSSTNVDDFWLNTNRQHNSTGRTRRPNVALIIGTERLPASVNHQPSGSRSPFAMPQQQAQFSNRFRASQPSQRLHQHHHDFESHRTSRMRQQQHQMNRANGVDTIPVSDSIASSTSSSSSSSSSLSSSSLASSTSTLSSLGDSPSPLNSKIVDDFVITTTSSNLHESPRAVTFLPPVVLSSLQSSHSKPMIDGTLSVPTTFVAPPKRTRGPFAFETLLSSEPNESDTTAAATSSPTAVDQPALSFEVGSSDDLTLPLASRAERSPSVARPQQRQVDDRLLLRKRLFLGSGDEELSSSSSTNPNTTLSDISYNDSTYLPRTVVPNQAQDTNTGRCQYFSCVAKGSSSGETICLNSTQICDDFIDCQDESDELDCVSLVRPSDEQGGQLSFSNGAGIIYLNRRGSLAPMCIDYYASNDGSSSSSTNSTQPVAGARIAPPPLPDSRRTNSAHDLEAMQLQTSDPARRQQELIRQINTIGQYACSLQSFSRLVSVKINQHDLVDGLNLIKSSKIYHRLGILSSPASSKQDEHSDSSHSAFKSGLSNYEVEISSGSDCLFERTVFVKCGNFECGQDSFSVMDHFGSPMSENGRARLNSNKKQRLQDGIVMNDFPWLVKLYWHDSLACHGYLIDESWLVAASQCFSNNDTMRTQNTDAWSAEISYEHYGNEDYKSFEPTKRRVKDIHFRQEAELPAHTNTERTPDVGSSIVLAKLDRPVRFSPLNRPICLPQARKANGSFDQQRQHRTVSSSSDLELDKNYKDCVTATLASHPSTSQSQTTPDRNNGNRKTPTQQGLILNKVRLSNKATDCLQYVDDDDADSLNKNFICVNHMSLESTSVIEDEITEDKHKTFDATGVLICLAKQATPRLRFKWTIVGVQNNKIPNTYRLTEGGRIFTRISSQMDWIVDITNPQPTNRTHDGFDKIMGSRLGAGHSVGDTQLEPNSDSALPPHLQRQSSFAEVPANNNLSVSRQQQSKCIWFRCSSGECLPWSRICDGLYDCSSRDDEKDCHK